MTAVQKRQMEILLIEDNPADVEIALESFKTCRTVNHLNVVSNGVDALLFLRKQIPFQDSPNPDIILLDLNLPKKSGHEVLNEIKQDPELSSIPVIILTSSKADEDVLKSYQLHANSYLTKPIDLEDSFKLAQDIEQFWLERAVLPV